MSKSFYDLLNEQIGHEFAASHQYLSMAIWLDGEDLPQLAKFFYQQSLEEREQTVCCPGSDAHLQVVEAGDDRTNNGVSQTKVEGGCGGVGEYYCQHRRNQKYGTAD